jgi:predicted RNase H-like HicB family nuclease
LLHCRERPNVIVDIEVDGMTKRYLVTAQWDNEANVWVATSDDIAGLVSEARTLDELFKRVVAVTPELLEDNGLSREDSNVIDMHVVSELSVSAAE